MLCGNPLSVIQQCVLRSRGGCYDVDGCGSPLLVIQQCVSACLIPLGAPESCEFAARWWAALAPVLWCADLMQRVVLIAVACPLGHLVATAAFLPLTNIVELNINKYYQARY